MVRRLNEGFKAGPKENRMLSKIYSAYKSIYDLDKHNLSVADYCAFPDVFKQLQDFGYAETFVKSLADFFKKNGFGVSIGDDGVKYVITFDDNVRESKKRPLKKTVKESIEPDNGYIEVYTVNRNKIESEFEDAVEEAMTYIGSDEAVPTWHWNIGEDEENYYAIVLGFTDEGNLACKWAYISKNSALNEYDMDYLMPYDSETGDVWDSEQIVDDGYGDVEYLLDNFKEYADQRNAEWDEFEDDLYGVDDEDDLEYESIRLKRESTNKRRPTSKRKQNK